MAEGMTTNRESMPRKERPRRGSQFTISDRALLKLEQLSKITAGSRSRAVELLILSDLAEDALLEARMAEKKTARARK
jgi:hypothetical protein